MQFPLCVIPSIKRLRARSFGIQSLFLGLFLFSFQSAVFAELTAPALKASTPLAYLTLQNALNLALNANPEIAVAMRESEAVEGLKTQAATRPNPSISTSIQDTRSAYRQVYLQLNQELELGNKRQARIDAADIFYSRSQAELVSKKAQIHANVIAAFYAVLVAQERLSLAQSSRDIAESASDAAHKRVRAGKSSPVEETKSNIASSSAKIELNQANTQLINARKRLAALWGSNPSIFANVVGDVTLVAEIPDSVDVSQLMEHAPAIQLAKIEIDSRGALTKIERSKATPNITVSAGVMNNQELGGINQALLGLSIPIPVFDRNQGNVQQAVSREYKAQDELVALKNQLTAHLSNQIERLSVAKQSAESLKTEILPSAQSAFDAANKGFSAGKFNFLDVLDAQRTLVQSKSQYINALLDAHEAVAEIERILGDVMHHQSQQLQE